MANPRRSRSVRTTYGGLPSTRHQAREYWNEAYLGDEWDEPTHQLFSPAYSNSIEQSHFYAADPRRSGHQPHYRMADHGQKVLPRAPSPPKYRAPARGTTRRPVSRHDNWQRTSSRPPHSPERGRRRVSEDGSRVASSARGTSLHIRISNEDGHETISVQEVESPITERHRRSNSSYIGTGSHSRYDMSQMRDAITGLDESDDDDDSLIAFANHEHRESMRSLASRVASRAPSRYRDSSSWNLERMNVRQRDRSVRAQSRRGRSRGYEDGSEEMRRSFITNDARRYSFAESVEPEDRYERRTIRSRPSRKTMRRPESSRRRRRQQYNSQEFLEIDRMRNRESGFEFPAIDFRHRQIRLVRILPATSSSHTTCEFEIAAIDDPKLKYIALSYAWGKADTEEDIVPIELHDQRFWIRRNLWGFLQQARTDPWLHNHLFWIDAICIDQAQNGIQGHQEKNHQVNMMGSIYKNAYEVISWLGEPERHMESALDHLERFFEGKLGERTGRNHLSAVETKKCSQAFRHIGASTYWTRIWVIQEVVKADKVTLRFGNFEFPWRNYYKLHALQILDIKFANLVARWDKYRKNQTLTPVQVLSQFSEQQCSDPRDKIYALLGLMAHSPVYPDYSKSCEELYEDYIEYLLKNKWIRNSSRGCSQRSCVFSVDLQEAFHLTNEATTIAHSRISERLGIDWRDYHPFTKECQYYVKGIRCLINTWN